MSEFEKLLNSKTKLVFVNHVSNALGIINPIKKIIDTAHKYNAVVSSGWSSGNPTYEDRCIRIRCGFLCNLLLIKFVAQQELGFCMEKKSG